MFEVLVCLYMEGGVGVSFGIYTICLPFTYNGYLLKLSPGWCPSMCRAIKHGVSPQLYYIDTLYLLCCITLSGFFKYCTCLIKRHVSSLNCWHILIIEMPGVQFLEES